MSSVEVVRRVFRDVERTVDSDIIHHIVERALENQFNNMQHFWARRGPPR